MYLPYRRKIALVEYCQSYFDQAQEVARLLSIKLTKRSWGGERIWMCGFPLMHLDKYLKVLVQQHKRPVALCEEFRKLEEGATAFSKPTFERRVVRILTPGTLVDESFLNPFENNFLLAISIPESCNEDYSDKKSMYGLAWIDVSTGEFFSRNAAVDTLKDHLARIAPREIVLDAAAPGQEALDAIREIGCPISYASANTVVSNEGSEDPGVDDSISVETSAASEVFSAAEQRAVAVLTSFLKAHLLEHTPPSLRPSREEKSKRMQIDAHTLKALEIQEGLREGGVVGSLMSTVKRTVTSSGTRLLARWLCELCLHRKRHLTDLLKGSPSTSVTEIRARQSLVELFRTRPALLKDIRELLKEVEDATRISQRFLLGRGSVDDLISIKETIESWETICGLLSIEEAMEMHQDQEKATESWSSLKHLMLRMSNLKSIAERINLAVESERPSLSLSEEDDGGGSIEDEPTDVETGLEEPRTSSFFGTDMKWTIRPQSDILPVPSCLLCVFTNF